MASMKIGGDYMRLIDADDLKKTWYKEHNIEPGESGAMFVGNNELPKFIDRARTIDAVPVVRCKDCFLYGECKAAEWYGENGNGYCSVGDRSRGDE